MSQTTYIATCPITGETATRKSSHPYTHSLTIKKTAQFKRDDSREGITVRDNARAVPTGYVRTKKCSSALYGYDCPALPIPANEQTTTVESLISFHESAELARKAAKAFEYGGWNVVEAIVVPCAVKGD